MRTPIQYVVYPWWPAAGDHWIHPQDAELVQHLIPSDRIFRWEQNEGPYHVLSYGSIQFRVKPSLWLPVIGEGFNIGDQVEVLSRMGKNRPFVATICEMRWHRQRKVIHYRLQRVDRRLPRRYTADELRHPNARTPVALPSPQE